MQFFKLVFTEGFTAFFFVTMSLHHFFLSPNFKLFTNQKKKVINNMALRQQMKARTV